MKGKGYYGGRTRCIRLAHLKGRTVVIAVIPFGDIIVILASQLRRDRQAW